MRVLAFAVMLSALATSARADNLAPPSWYLEDVAALTMHGGRWVADNAAFKSESEPFEAYVIEWTAGFDGVALTGRLFAMKEGKQTPTFWEFRQYWRPDEARAVVEQFGWGGTIGVGAYSKDGDEIVMDQTFHAPGQPSRREGHRNKFQSTDVYITQSFEIVEGEWLPRRKYVWKRDSPKSSP